jgi:5-(carboxyamino)imidazole ribonucleotide synthase
MGVCALEIIENRHRNHILDLSFAPVDISSSVTKEAIEITRGVLEQLNVVGVLCVEFFLTREGRLLINELAPRPHNSGHLTFDACVTSQFEQRLRAVCGLPLGSTELLKPAAMANLLGDLWQTANRVGRQRVEYPKSSCIFVEALTKVGRKMGHLTALAASPKQPSSLSARLVAH